MTTPGKTARPDPEPALSITAETATMAADMMVLVAAGSDPHDKKRSILRYPEDIEPTLDSLATVTGQLPRILDQLSVFLADRKRRAEFAVDEATEASRGPEVESEAMTAAQLLAGAVPAARELAAALEDAKRTITPDPRRRRRRELLGLRRRRSYPARTPALTREGRPALSGTCDGLDLRWPRPAAARRTP